MLIFRTFLTKRNGGKTRTYFLTILCGRELSTEFNYLDIDYIRFPCWQFWMESAKLFGFRL